MKEEFDDKKSLSEIAFGKEQMRFSELNPGAFHYIQFSILALAVASFDLLYKGSMFAQ
jgi:hypothetical protein